MLKTILFLILVFIIFAVNYDNKYIEGIDTAVSLLFEKIRADWLTDLFFALSHIGSLKIMLPLCIIMSIVLVVKKKYVHAVSLMLLFFLVRVLNTYLKEFFLRERPLFDFLYKENGYSFPSGHSMNSAAVYSFLCFILIETFILSEKVKKMLVAGTAVLILLIGVSRIYLGVHFLTDVLAGFAAGICTFLVVKIALAKIQQVFDKNRTV